MFSIPEKLPFDYRILLIIPIAIAIFSFVSLAMRYSSTGEWFERSIELKGGTLLTIESNERFDIPSIEAALSERFGEVRIREVRTVEGFGLTIEMEENTNVSNVLTLLESMGVQVKDYSVETVGPALGSSFWRQAQLAIAIAFIFMGIIVFIIFRSFVPSLAVILSAMFDMLNTIAFMQISGIDLSLAGLAALLMLIGYSVDTDIMLTTRLLKEEEKSRRERMINAIKTGLTMTLTTIGALIALLASAVSPVLSQIAAVLLMGLLFDIINTWLMNAVVLKWYMERRG